MLGLYSLGQGGFFAIGAYLTTIIVNELGWNAFLMLFVVLAAAGGVGLAVGALSLRVSGLYFAITSFIFTLVLTVLATDLKITGGLQGLLGPAFPDFPTVLPGSVRRSPGASCSGCSSVQELSGTFDSRRSIPCFSPFATRNALRRPRASAPPSSRLAFSVSRPRWRAARAGFFPSWASYRPANSTWSVSLNILVMVLIGGINTTLGPSDRAAFVSMFPALVNINPWLQEMVYGALSILAVTLLPGGVMSLLRLRRPARAMPEAETAAAEPEAGEPIEASLFRRLAGDKHGNSNANVTDPAYAVECRNIGFSYPNGPPVLRDVSLEVRRGHIHGLIGPNGSGKSTLANVIAGRLQPLAGTALINGVRVDGAPPRKRAQLGLRRTFQAAELVRELTPGQNVMVGLFDSKPRIVERAAIWPLLPSARRDMAWMESRSRDALQMVGAGSWGRTQNWRRAAWGRATHPVGVGLRRCARHYPA